MFMAISDEVKVQFSFFQCFVNASITIRQGKMLINLEDASVDVSLSVPHEHELWIWFKLSYAMMKV